MIRAGVSVLMLIGFYLVALAQLAGAVVLTVWLGSVTSGLIAAKIAIPLFVAIVGGAGVAIWRAMRAKPEDPEGLSVGPDQAPALWHMAHLLAREVQVRPPDEIRLVPDVNAAVSERSRMLGLVGGRRTLYIGLPLLQVFTMDQLRSVLAHEMGHFSGNHTRLGAVAYRGRLTVAETLGRISPYNVAGWIFKGYGLLYVLVDNAATRRQEFEADQASVRVAGRAAAASALRELPLLVAAMRFYLHRYVKPGWETGNAPADLFGGFAELVAARQAELAEMRSSELERESSLWNTHPPLVDRISAIAATPYDRPPYDTRSAAVLLPDITATGLRMQRMMIDIGDRAVLNWPEFTNATLTAQLQRGADRVFREIARRTQITHLHLGVVFELIAAGKLGQIAEPFFPDATRREAGPRFAEVLEELLQLAALRSGVACWQHSWSGPAQFSSVHGGPLPLQEIAKLAVAPDGLNEAWRRLAELRIDVRQAALVAQQADATGAGVIAALANLKLNGQDQDLIVLSNGLVFVANPGPVDGGKRRLEDLLQSASAAGLAGQNWFLPYEEIAGGEVLKEVPARLTLTLHNGEQLNLQERWTGEMVTKNSRDVLLEV
ncbi:MAG: M48 family metallopeptidase, partial [Micromonosporaceae bacterium]